MPSPTDVSTYAPPVFASIVCGVDDSGPSFEAARQAALLADEGAALTFAAVTWEQGSGSAVPTVARASDPTSALLELASGQSLLVVGIGGHSRAAGIVLGSAATAAVHRSPVPVLVARRPPDGVEFPRRILLASDGTPASDAAASLTARLAARHGAAVAIVGVVEGEAPFRPGLDEHAARIKAATGAEPVVFVDGGPAHHGVATAARDFEAALVVTGSRSLGGLPALRSTSERIAHFAPCSVLTVRS